MKELMEEKQRQVIAHQKQEKEAYKKALKKERKELRSLCKVIVRLLMICHSAVL